MNYLAKNRLKNIITRSIFLLLSSVFQQTFAQLDDDIIITKDRKIELPAANKGFEKIPPVTSNPEDRAMKYAFFDRKPQGVEEVKFNPIVVLPNNSNKEEAEKYNNYISLGAGNYGRIFGEAYINTIQSKSMVLGIHAVHNSTNRGPIDGKNSANMYDKAELTGKYLADKFQLNAGLLYNRDQYYFYGYKRPVATDFDRKNIRQVLNTVQANFGFENIVPNPRVDYALKTSLRSLKDSYAAQETDWTTTFNAYFPIINEKFVALIDADANMAQRSDGEIDKRNLFRVEPSFKLNFNSFGAKIGYRAVNEFDEVKGINQTKGFPVAEITYKAPALIYVFAGVTGDIIRNTLGSFLTENPYLKPQTKLLNTEKIREFYVGGKGDIGSGVSFNVKASMGYYRNLYYFNNYSPTDATLLSDTSKFEVLYDSLKTQYINTVVQFNYQASELWRTYLRTDFNHYQRKSYEKPFHRPLFSVKWGNSLIVSDRLIANLDVYYQSKTYAKSPTTQQLITNKSIIDINSEFDYLFSKKFTAFVKLNNILGRKYERYLYYPQQGLNFLVGINYSF